MSPYDISGTVQLPRRFEAASDMLEVRRGFSWNSLPLREILVTCAGVFVFAVRHATTRHDMTRQDTTGHGTTRHDTARQDVTLRYAMPRYATISRVVSCYATLRYALLRYTILRQVILWLCHAMLDHIMSSYVMLYKSSRRPFLVAEQFSHHVDRNSSCTPLRLPAFWTAFGLF